MYIRESLFFYFSFAKTIALISSFNRIIIFKCDSHVCNNEQHNFNTMDYGMLNLEHIMLN